MADRRPWLEVLFFIRPRVPGPPLAPDTTTDCRGCGRRIPLNGIHLDDKLRCQGCGRIHWITEKLLASNDVKKFQAWEQRLVSLAGLVILGLCLLAVAPMAAKTGETLLATGCLYLLGSSALGLAVFLNLLCYGIGTAVGLTLIWLLKVLRRHTMELGIIGAVMTLLGGLGGVIFYLLGEQMGHPFTASLPYGLVAWGTLSTIGALWRASLFPKR